ncbi:hypothetical protein [Campylobacter concisus]
MSVGHCFANFKNCYSKNNMALCKKFDEIYEYGKLLREKKALLWQGKFIKGAVKIVEVKIAKQGKSFCKFKQI